MRTQKVAKAGQKTVKSTRAKGKNGQPPAVPQAWQELDFRAQGPLPFVCDVCRRAYEGWEVPCEDWRLLPPEYHQLQLCEEDYRQLLQQAGHDPEKVRITHNTWRALLERWEEVKDIPAHHALVLFEGEIDGEPLGESCWCEVLRHVGGCRFEVRLRHAVLVKPWLDAGDRFLVAWDGCWHRYSARPQFRPIRRLPAPGSGKKRSHTRRRAS
jgi:hypothetical protein